jgi:glutaredoxin
MATGGTAREAYGSPAKKSGTAGCGRSAAPGSAAPAVPSFFAGLLSSGSMAAVILYRCGTPTNRLCACGRVARELAARGIEVEERRVAWRRRDRDEIDALTGQRAVPVLVLGREAICDSKRIVEHLRWLDGERQRANSVDPAEAVRR